ncbi:YgfZ/GcvT domain-containing protein [Nitratireductor luteus]|uniref:CAF17-like 4Fe-4S cluster assembly/insertion protein YgfZ n=1 Tax=Nitratireductor luteus TaxID=2976980 RepID=UPI00223F2C98|nr:folate-binding protein YgfZ [Nitratireductor luteus]
MPTIHLSDRAVISVTGPEAESFLQNVITTDLSSLTPGKARPGALLTPQGKILFDFVVARAGEGAFRIDCRKDLTDDLVKRLMLYRMRAKAEISVMDQEHVTVSWENDSGGEGVADERFPESIDVKRIYGTQPAAAGERNLWEQLRIVHGVAESGADYTLGDAFPHDVLFDQNAGVGLKKGCYVGQEVVSRMQHRGTARRRLVIVRAEAPLPPPGCELSADGRALGSLGTVEGQDGLAIVRIDRVAEANARGAPITAGGIPVSLSVPAYASFSLNGETA